MSAASKRSEITGGKDENELFDGLEDSQNGVQKNKKKKQKKHILPSVEQHKYHRLKKKYALLERSTAKLRHHVKKLEKENDKLRANFLDLQQSSAQVIQRKDDRIQELTDQVQQYISRLQTSQLLHHQRDQTRRLSHDRGHRGHHSQSPDLSHRDHNSQSPDVRGHLRHAATRREKRTRETSCNKGNSRQKRRRGDEHHPRHRQTEVVTHQRSQPRLGDNGGVASRGHCDHQPCRSSSQHSASPRCDSRQSDFHTQSPVAITDAQYHSDPDLRTLRMLHSGYSDREHGRSQNDSNRRSGKTQGRDRKTHEKSLQQEELAVGQQAVAGRVKEGPKQQSGISDQERIRAYISLAQRQTLVQQIAFKNSQKLRNRMIANYTSRSADHADYIASLHMARDSETNRDSSGSDTSGTSRLSAFDNSRNVADLTTSDIVATNRPSTSVAAAQCVPSPGGQETSVAAAQCVPSPGGQETSVAAAQCVPSPGGHETQVKDEHPTKPDPIVERSANVVEESSYQTNTCIGGRVNTTQGNTIYQDLPVKGALADSCDSHVFGNGYGNTGSIRTIRDVCEMNTGGSRVSQDATAPLGMLLSVLNQSCNPRQQTHRPSAVQTSQSPPVANLLNMLFGKAMSSPVPDVAVTRVPLTTGDSAENTPQECTTLDCLPDRSVQAVSCMPPVAVAPCQAVTRDLRCDGTVQRSDETVTGGWKPNTTSITHHVERSVSDIKPGKTDSLGDTTLCKTRSMNDVTPYNSKLFGDVKPCNSKLFGDVKPCNSKLFGDVRPCNSKSFGDVKPCNSKSFGDVKPCHSKSFGDITQSKTEPLDDITLVKTASFSDITPDKNESLPTLANTTNDRDKNESDVMIQGKCGFTSSSHKDERQCTDPDRGNRLKSSGKRHTVKHKHISAADRNTTEVSSRTRTQHSPGSEKRERTGQNYVIAADARERAKFVSDSLTTDSCSSQPTHSTAAEIIPAKPAETNMDSTPADDDEDDDAGDFAFVIDTNVSPVSSDIDDSSVRKDEDLWDISLQSDYKHDRGHKAPAGSECRKHGELTRPAEAATVATHTAAARNDVSCATLQDPSRVVNSRDHRKPDNATLGRRSAGDSSKVRSTPAKSKPSSQVDQDDGPEKTHRLSDQHRRRQKETCENRRPIHHRNRPRKDATRRHSESKTVEGGTCRAIHKAKCHNGRTAPSASLCNVRSATTDTGPVRNVSVKRDHPAKGHRTEITGNSKRTHRDRDDLKNPITSGGTPPSKRAPHARADLNTNPLSSGRTPPSQRAPHARADLKTNRLSSGGTPPSKIASHVRADLTSNPLSSGRTSPIKETHHARADIKNKLLTSGGHISNKKAHSAREDLKNHSLTSGRTPPNKGSHSARDDSKDCVTNDESAPNKTTLSVRDDFKNTLAHDESLATQGVVNDARDNDTGRQTPCVAETDGDSVEEGEILSDEDPVSASDVTVRRRVGDTHSSTDGACRTQGHGTGRERPSRHGPRHR